MHSSMNVFEMLELDAGTDEAIFKQARGNIHLANVFECFQAHDFERARQLLDSSSEGFSGSEWHMQRLRKIAAFLSRSENQIFAPTPYYRAPQGWAKLEELAGAVQMSGDTEAAKLPEGTLLRVESVLVTDVAVLREQIDLARKIQREKLLNTLSLCSEEMSLDPEKDEIFVFSDNNKKEWRLSRRVIGRGAFGTVRLGMGDDGRFVAVKQVVIPKHAKKKRSLSANPAEKEDPVIGLMQEVVLMSQLRHDNIVPYVGCSLVGFHMMIVMEYVSGGSLYEVLKEFGTIQPSSLKRYCRDILHGLVYLHERDVVHRDVKPQNVLVMIDGTCKLTDFGASAKLLELQEGGALVGTPLYMSPEQCEGAVQKPSDVWSFGVMVAELATGTPPWPDVEIRGRAFCYQLSRNEAMAPVLPDDMNGVLRDFIQLCVARDPTKRWTAAQLLGHAFLAG
jgi:hypothetical protein